MSPLAQNTITKACQAAKKTLDELKPIIDQLNIIYDSAGGLKATLTQEELDNVPSLSGLTKAQLDDGMYALTATLKGAIDATFVSLAQLAVRA